MTNDATKPFPELQKSDEDVNQRDESNSDAAFPIVGIGASAGGLEAFTQLLKSLPADTGMAFVLVQHLAPTHASALAEILGRATTMLVMEVHDETTVEPNNVYVIPPDRSMIIVQGILQLLPRESPGVHHPVDQFFRSLAQEQRHQAIGVVLSGTATDGTIGLEEIKAEGGITFAQDATAQHEGMPHSAIASGCVDFVLPPIEIAREIVRIGQHPYAVPEAESSLADDKTNLAQVLQILHHATGVDFTGYKFNTLYRRVTRRMVFRKMDGLNEYVEFLRETPAEVEALYQDILISVTSFFRDKESFEALKRTVFPRLLKDRSRHDPVRLWTLGCSTGQEAYSLAMAFTEAAEAIGSSVPIQLFASDLNATGIEKARAGIYSKDIAQDVSPERLRRFFTEVDGNYRISKTIRDACVFSRHNVLSDPPFSRIDLISCRNLLIYMEPVLQQRIMPTLHYALKPTGCLWLGGSETIGTYRDLFDAEDSKHRIYAKKPGSIQGHDRLPTQNSGSTRMPFVPIAARANDAADLHREADRVLLSKFVPPSVLVSADLDILQYRGDTSPFLAPAPGKASLHLLKMLREGLLVAVRAAVLRAGKEHATVREEGLQVKSVGGYHEVAIEVIPIKGGTKDGGFLILFEDSSASSRGRNQPVAEAPPVANASGSLEAENSRLEQELVSTREYLQSVIEEQEAFNEELQSASEEVQSANEELQSTNEELETSKEEIQSTNEELATVNDELNNRNVELHRVNNDLVNLIASVQMAIVMLGPDLRVRRFTPMAEKLLSLIPTDVGRPFCDINCNLEEIPDLRPLLAKVIDTLSIQEREVRDKQGHWYSLRLRPYRTLENKVDGVVVVLVDIDAMKRAHEIVRTGEAQYRALFGATAIGVSESDPVAGRLLRFNKQFEQMLGYTESELLNKTFLDVTHPDDQPDYWNEYSRMLRGEVASYQAEKRLVRKDGTFFWVQVTENLVVDADVPSCTVAITVDIAERKLAESLIQSQKQTLEMLIKDVPIEEVLDFLVRSMENQSQGGFLVAIHLLEEDGFHFGLVVAPSLPASYTQAAKGMDARLQLRPYCEAVVSHEPTVVVDFADESRWPTFIVEALSLGLRGCTTFPIISSNQRVLGTLTIYYCNPEFTSSKHQQLVHIAVHSVAITVERMQAEKTLREAEERFRMLADNMAQFSWMADAKGWIFWYNQRWYDYTGTSLEEMQGWGWQKVHHPDHVERVVNRIQHSWDTGEPWEDTFPLRDRAGNYRWFLSRAIPIRDQAGTVIRWLGTNTDITEQREMADALRRNAEELSEADSRKNEFLAMLAHELRNPLAPIRNALQIMRLTNENGSGNESGNGQAIASEMMERQVNQMVRLVDDLLDVSRVSRGKIELRKERIDLTSMVQHAIEACRPLVDSAGLDLDISLPSQPIYLNADPVRLTQVVGNLFNNACKFTDKGGRIELALSIEPRENDQESIGDQSLLSPSSAVIRVRDSGVGIQADQLHRIFDMFLQIDTSLERSVSGLGIGLTLVKNLVEMHGGTVEAHSAGIGHGSEFVVRLPLEIVESLAVIDGNVESERVSAGSPAATPRRILVVDDNRDSATTLAMLLKLLGNETRTAYDGVAALEAAETFKPDVVLLDIGLPKLNGYEVCRKIRSEPWGKAMVVLALTGWGQKEDREKSQAAGFDHHLVKPVDIAALTKLLTEFPIIPSLVPGA